MQIATCKLQLEEMAQHDSLAPFVIGQSITREAMGNRFLDFAERVCSVVEALPRTKIGNRIANQLLGSGTSQLAIIRKPVRPRARMTSFTSFGFVSRKFENRVVGFDSLRAENWCAAAAGRLD